MKEENRTRDDKLKRRYHLLLCLRPAVMENLSTKCSSGSPFKHLRVKSFDAAVVPARILPPTTLPSSASEKDSAAAGLNKKKSTRRKFVRLIKAVLFETSLANKIKKKAKKKKQITNNGASESKDTYPIITAPPILNKKVRKKSQGKIISSTPSIETTSNYASSSRASSIASCSSSKRYPDSDFTINSIENPKVQVDENGNKESLRGFYGVNTGLSLLLVALLVLVVWGKLFAILCTSAWLFFVPNWKQGKLLLKGRLASRSMDKEEYNKKIIMEGFLDRKRS